MKKLASTLAIGMALVSASAMASDGTITFNGEVSAVTCIINGGSPSFPVTLPKVSTSAFTGYPGTTAGKTAFTIKLTGCTNFTGKYVRAYFEPGPTVISTPTPTNGYLRNTAGTGASTGVVVRLSNARGIFINPNLGVDAQQDMNYDGAGFTTNGEATMTYYAEYITSGIPVPGILSTSIVYSLHYW